MKSETTFHTCMWHEPQSRRFVNKLDDGRVLLKLQSECEEIREAHLVTRKGAEHALERIGHVNGRDHFSVLLPAASRMEYAFRVHACGAERWVGPDGANSWYKYDPGAHGAFETPAWVRDDWSRGLRWKELATRYRVSPQAVGIALDQLRVIG